MMKRREFITLLGGAAAWPLAARAQQPAMPLVGILHQGASQPNRQFIYWFLQGLRQAGFVEHAFVPTSPSCIALRSISQRVYRDLAPRGLLWVDAVEKVVFHR